MVRKLLRGLVLLEARTSFKFVSAKPAQQEIPKIFLNATDKTDNDPETSAAKLYYCTRSP